ncbi:TetR/AcrR family transcriptional regulator [Streptomyces sp. B6B3]|uniref:TetR/AcrR family transcriptional regulator n=1 Tax=Streptomyces sp. B6B3 TaxID=3153570 RepID=UPI00325DA2EC
MPTARESLLEAARDAVERRPWPVVRMVEVAAAAGVSRQTLYNEFGDKAGLGVALVGHQVAGFLDGFVTGLRGLTGSPADATRASPEALLSGAADWMADWLPQAARRDRLVRATLTGCHTPDLPPCDGEPGRLVVELRERALRVLRGTPAAEPGGADGHAGAAGPDGARAAPGVDGQLAEAELARRCETAIRLALSHIVAPAPGADAGPAPGYLPPHRPARFVHPPVGAWGHRPGPQGLGDGQSPSRRSRVASSRRSE